MNGDMLLPSTIGSGQPGSKERANSPVFSKVDIGHARPLAIGRAPTANDCDRDLEGLAPLLGGVPGSAAGLTEGEVAGDEEGEKVGYGEVECVRDSEFSS